VALNIGLHKISLGALILSLGLLVDDAIIAVEMMAIKLEQGFDRFRAASFAYSSTAFPMLTGTLVTVAGFLPIALAKSSTGEYTRSIFQVSAIALIASWVIAVVVIPYLGYKMLPEGDKLHEPSFVRRLWSRLTGRAMPPPRAADHDVYATPFYDRLRSILAWCVSHRVTVLVATLAIFVGAVALFRFVPQQFFPASSRVELLVDLRLAEGSSFAASMKAAKKLEAVLDKDPGVESYVTYVGSGAPRFYLPLDQQLTQSNFAQVVLIAKSIDDREKVRGRLLALFESDFPELRGRISRLENGPPVGFPVQFRVSGENIATIRAIAEKVAKVMRDDPETSQVQFDWDEPSKVIRVAIDQNKARVLGISSQDLATFLNNSLSGFSVTYYRERDKQVEVVLRGATDERARMSFLKDLAIPARNGRAVPITQIADIEYDLEDGIVWRRNRLPTITVRSDVQGDAQGPDVAKRIEQKLTPLRADLPLGYRIELGGAIEDSARGQKSIAAGVPLLVIAVLALLMIQLRSFARTAMVVLTAPLGLIGVVLALLVFGKPFGFVAMLGTIALAGIIMRNSIILVDQIDQDIAAGHAPWEAVIGATVRRFRPIVLTAAAAVLALIPLVRSDFFGPMAVAMMGGIVVATVLTLVFLPALYAAWFQGARIRGCSRWSAAAGGPSPHERWGKIERDTRVGVRMAVMPLASVPEIVAELKAGRMVVLVDEEDRENEGDVVIAADFVTPEAINFMAKHARGLVCLTLRRKTLPQAGPRPMVSANRSGHGTTSRPRSKRRKGSRRESRPAGPRAHRARSRWRPEARPFRHRAARQHLPVMAQPGGVLVRAGHTEAGCDLAPDSPASRPPPGHLRDHARRRRPWRGCPTSRSSRRSWLSSARSPTSFTIAAAPSGLVERIASDRSPHARCVQLVVYRDKISDADAPCAGRGPVAPTPRRWCACTSRCR
jgi:3,4-dihydroxy-2-butanone 4-phosphate synthase